MRLNGNKEQIFQHRIVVPQAVSLETIDWVGSMMDEVSLLIHQGHPFSVWVDMAETRRVTPTGLASLAAFMKFISLHPLFRRSSYTRPELKETSNLLSKMHFYKLFNLNDPEVLAPTKSIRYYRSLVEITSEKSASKIVSDLTKVLKTKPPLDVEILETLKYALSELIDNVFHHAKSSINALVNAQAYPAEKRVEFAIVDCGRGFRKSLQENELLRGQFSTAVEAITLATQPKITSSPERNAGQGLFFITELIRQTGGSMVIYSENGIFRIIDGKESHITTTVNWPGVIVGASLPVDSSVTLVDIFNQFAPADADYEFLGAV